MLRIAEVGSREHGRRQIRLARLRNGTMQEALPLGGHAKALAETKGCDDCVRRSFLQRQPQESTHS